MAKGDEKLTEEEVFQEYDFRSMSTPGFAGFLERHNISLAVTSYDCHRLILFRSGETGLDTHLVPVARPFGLAVKGDRISIASYSEVIHYKRTDQLLSKAVSLDDKLSRADALFLPYDRHITGYINLHDMEWCGDELWFVNSREGCISSLAPGCHFTNQWFPYFFRKDRKNNANHLNGMAVNKGKPKYASCFHTLKKEIDWKELNDPFSGGIIEIETNELIAQNLSVPHTPRLHGEYLYFCHSGMGLVERIHLSSGKREVLLELPGYARGLEFYGDKMLVGTSRVRLSKGVVKLPVHDILEESIAAVFIVDLSSFAVTDYTTFTGDVKQIYDIKVIENCQKPIMPGVQDEILMNLYQTEPDKNYNAFA